MQAITSAVENDNKHTEYKDLITLSGSKIEGASSCEAVILNGLLFPVICKI